MRRALELDESFDRGALHTFMVAYEAARPGARSAGPSSARAGTSRAPWSSPRRSRRGADGRAGRDGQRAAAAARRIRGAARPGLAHRRRARRASRASPSSWPSAARAGCFRAPTGCFPIERSLMPRIHRSPSRRWHRRAGCQPRSRKREEAIGDPPRRARPARHRLASQAAGDRREMARRAGPGRAVHRLQRRLAGRRGRHGAAHARRPAQRRDALGHRPDRDRRLGGRAAKDADGVPLLGRARLRAREAAPGAREALSRQGLRGAVLGRCRLGALLLQGAGAAARRLPPDEDVRLGGRHPAGRHHEGAGLPAGGARGLRHPARACRPA